MITQRKLYKCLALALGLMLTLTACSDKDDNAPRVIPTMAITVSEIADNMARITSEQKTGTTYGAKVINYYPVSDITFDYNIEVKLVKFVEENGIPVTLPYDYKIEKGLKPGVNYISAIIVYNEQGRAVCSAFQTWKADGTEGTWSNGGSAGSLEETDWSKSK